MSQNNQILDCFEQLDGHLLLKLKIKGAPEKGKVNAELIDFLSEQLALPKSKIQIIAGLTSRNKILRINS